MDRTRVAAAGLVALAALSAVPTAAAHGGSVHGSTPHPALLAAVAVGLVLLGGAASLSGRAPGGLLAATATLGAGLAGLGAAGLVEVQAEPSTAAVLPRGLYPVVRFLVGFGLMGGALALWHRRWHRLGAGVPLVGVVLGLWVLYPGLVPGETTQLYHPLGYLLVAALPVLVGLVLWREVRPALTGVAVDRTPPLAGAFAGLGFALFYLVSAGLMTFNPVEEGVPDRAFVVRETFANPLVMWPAVEAYLPSVPLFLAVNVGTLIAVSLLVALVGTNVALLVGVRRAGIDLVPSEGVAGTAATTGATACCCCGPAVYGVASAALGASASPLYWAFVDPASPLGTLFFVAAVALLLGSSVRLARRLEPVGRSTPG